MHDSSVACLGRVLSQAIDTMCAQAGEAAVKLARKQWEDRRGIVHQEQPQWEQWTQSFLDWYALEHLPSAWMQPKAEREVEAWKAWTNSHRSLMEVQSLGDGYMDVMDLLGGARFRVSEPRELHGILLGQVAEMRLVGFEHKVWLGRICCFHPAGTEKHLRKIGQSTTPANRLATVDAVARTYLTSLQYAHLDAMAVYAQCIVDDTTKGQSSAV